MNLKDFEKEYLSLLSSQDSDKLEKLIQLVADNTENMEIPTDYFIKVSDEVIKLSKHEISADDIVKAHQATPIVELKQTTLENSEQQPVHSQTLEKQKHGEIFNTKNLKNAALVGLALFVGYQGLQHLQPQPQQDVAPTTETKKETSSEYEKLAVKDGTNFNPNDFNQLTDAAANLGKELSAGGFTSYYNVETGEYKPITAEDALMLTEALNLGSNEYDEWRKAQIQHDESSAQRYDEIMNELYTFTVADAMSLTNSENSKVDYTKFIANQDLATMLNGLQDDIIAYNDAKPEAKKTQAKSLLDKWITAMENRSDLPTNDAVMSVMQAQMYGFVNRMQFDGLSFQTVGFDESRFANIFYDLPSCQEIDKDAYDAYWHGNIRTEDSDVTVNRMDRKVDFEGFFNEVKTNKEEIKEGIEEKKYKDDAEWEDLIELISKKMGDLKVIPNPDFTQAKIDALLAEQGGIDLQPGETIQYDANGNAYVLAPGTVMGEGANLPSEEEVTQQIEEEKQEMQEDAAKYYDTGMNDAMANGDRTGSLMNVPGGISEAEQNGYKTGYSRGVEYNKIAYQLGLEGQQLSGELSNCQNAYNEGYKQYQANQEKEEQEEQQDQVDYQKMAEEAYNAGYAAFESGASRDSVPDKYKDFTVEWQNGWDNAKDIKDHNVGNITDGPAEGDQIDDGQPELPAEPEVPEVPAEPETPTDSGQSQPEQSETPAYTWNDVYNAGVQAAYAAGANTTGAPCAACPTQYAGFEDAWAAGWGTALAEYEMNKDYYENQAQQAQATQEEAQKTR